MRARSLLLSSPVSLWPSQRARKVLSRSRPRFRYSGASIAVSGAVWACFAGNSLPYSAASSAGRPAMGMGRNGLPVTVKYRFSLYISTASPVSLLSVFFRPLVGMSPRTKICSPVPLGLYSV